MLKKVLLVLIVAAGALIAVVATRPTDFRYVRSGMVPGSPELAFGLVNDLGKWGAWSPWDKRDPNMQRTLDREAPGVGQVYGWSGNDDVGKGRMTITESVPAEKVGIKLEFLEPWQAENQTTFTFTRKGEGTEVTWAMEGKNDFAGKAFGLVMDMEALIGKDFEEGLANMAKAADAELKRRAAEEAAARANAPVEEAPADE